MNLDIRQFNEWKQSNDYLIQSWFQTKKKAMTEWFDTDAFKDITFDYFEFSESDANGIYMAQMYFNEVDVQFTLEMIIDAEKVIDGLVSEIQLNLKGYGTQSDDMLGMITKTVDEPALTTELLLNMITEFKTDYVDTKE